MKIKFKDEKAVLPIYATEGSAAVDLVAHSFIAKYNDRNAKVSEEHMKLNVENIHILPGERLLVGTGLYMAIPDGYVADIRPRSGRALKEGLTVANTPGTIDSDYRGEVGVILTNVSHVPIYVAIGEKIAQLAFFKVERPTFNFVDELPSTDRGAGGFGSTGK